MAAADLFDEATARAIAGRFARVLAAVAADPAVRLRQVQVLDAAERAQVLDGWNDTAAAVPAGPVPELIAAQAARTPDAVAVAAGIWRVSYGELDGRADRLARVLAARGRARRRWWRCAWTGRPELVAALLAVWKAGRRTCRWTRATRPSGSAFMLADARRGGWWSRPGGWRPGCRGLAVVALADPRPRRRSRRAGLRCRSRPARAGEPGVRDLHVRVDRAPKGVAVPQAAVVNFLAAMAGWFRLGAADRLVAVTTVSFDIHVLELYLPLLAGAGVVVARARAVRDPALLAGLLRRCGATIMQGTPALWQAVLAVPEADWPGCGCWPAGEALPPALAARLRGAAAVVTNLYGPTEVTVWATAAAARLRDRASRCSRSAAEPIGRAGGQYPGVRAGRVAGAGPGRGGGGAVPGRGAAGPGLPGPARG